MVVSWMTLFSKKVVPLNYKGNHLKSEPSYPIWLSERALPFSQHNYYYLCQLGFRLREAWLWGHSNHKATAPYFAIRRYWPTWINNLSAASSSDVPCPLHLYHDPSPNKPLYKPHRLRATLAAPRQCSSRNTTDGNGKATQNRSCFVFRV